MIKVLTLDDNARKVKDLREFFSKIPDVSVHDIAVDLVSARQHLHSNHYDLLILDLGIPNRIGDDPLPKNGIEFLDEINKTSRIIKPSHIIGLSEHQNYINEFYSNFQDELWALIKYSESSNGWEKQLAKKINYLIQSKRDLQNTANSSYDFDLAILTALRTPELDAILNLPANWNPFTLNNDATEYHQGYFEKDSKRIKVVAAHAPQMGMVAASVLANKLIVNFRPKYIAITGIAGGIKGVGNFGDILVADISFDSGSGKIKTDANGNAKFYPDYRSIDFNTDLKEAFLACKGRREYLNEIKKKWQGNKSDKELDIHIGPFASGAGVIENEKIIEEIKGHSRKLVGIDMESYGVFYTAKNCSKPRPLAALSLKSISDFANPDKDDAYQAYAAYTSANYLYNFALDKMNFT